jgi:hypothetical protein
MTNRRLLTISAIALGLSAAASAVFAHGLGGYVCQTWNSSKNTPAITHCVTWNRDATDRMRSNGCDPSKMANDAMRALCSQMSDGSNRSRTGRKLSDGRF